MPLSDQAISFCRHVQLDLQARTGSDLGLAILNYSTSLPWLVFVHVVILIMFLRSTARFNISDSD